MTRRETRVTHIECDHCKHLWEAGTFYQDGRFSLYGYGEGRTCVQILNINPASNEGIRGNFDFCGIKCFASFLNIKEGAFHDD